MRSGTIRAAVTSVLLSCGMAAAAQQSVERSIESQYGVYVKRLKESPPRSLVDLYHTLLSWLPLTRQVAIAGKPVSSPARSPFESRTGAIISVRVDSITVTGGRATVLVTKRVGGAFREDGQYRHGEALGVVHSKHVWRDTGDGWRLMADIPLEGSLNVDGVAFGPPRKTFDPNTAFSKPGDVLQGENTAF